MFDYVGNIQDGAIVGWDVGIGGQEEVATSVASGFWFTQVAGIAVGCQNHVASMVRENGSVLRG